MSYTEILALAQTRLGAEYNYVVLEIKSKIKSGSTGGEIGSLVGGYLKSLKHENHPAYTILKSEIDLYLSQFKIQAEFVMIQELSPLSIAAFLREQETTGMVVRRLRPRTAGG